jgi:hypothetical protein
MDKTNYCVLGNDMYCEWMGIAVRKQQHIPCISVKAPSALKNSVKITVVNRAFLLSQYFMFSKLHGFNDFPAMIGIDNKAMRVVTVSHTSVITRLSREK